MKKLIFILLFFFALLIPLAFNAPSRIYDVFAVAPTPFGPGPVVPPNGEGGGGTGTTIPVQTPVAGRAFNGWNGTSFDTVVMPTAAPTATPIPASTPVASQWVTGWNAGLGTPTRSQPQLSDLSDASSVCTLTDGKVTTDELPDNTTYLGSSIDLTTSVSGILPTTNGGTGCAGGTDCKIATTGNYTRASGTLDFSAGAILDPPHETADHTCPGGGAWINDTSGLVCYCTGSTKVCLNDVSSAGIVTSCTVGSDYGVISQSGATQRILLSNMEVGKADAVPSGTSQTPGAAGAIGVDTTDDQLKYYGAATRTLSYKRTACIELEALAATDDDYMLASFVDAVTITSVWCNCKGTCGSGTLATFTLEQANGTGMTITDTNPVCAASNAVATPKAVTANNALAANEPLRFSVSNTPTAGDTYLLCVSYVVNAL